MVSPNSETKLCKGKKESRIKLTSWGFSMRGSFVGFFTEKDLFSSNAILPIRFEVSSDFTSSVLLDVFGGGAIGVVAATGGGAVELGGAAGGAAIAAGVGGGAAAFILPPLGGGPGGLGPAGLGGGGPAAAVCALGGVGGGTAAGFAGGGRDTSGGFTTYKHI